MSLDRWQENIYDQFKLLHEFRAGTTSKNPVFALEHALNPSELESLKADLRLHIATQDPSDRHWLLWVVYAAEIGYVYDGLEYWPIFESNTPGWNRFRGKYRTWIKKCFLKFRDEFHGVEPSGPWARKFNNICWPIAHAILPHYLQHQLTKALFDLRLFFRAEFFESPLELGNFIATNCRTGTSRFQEFLENPVLVGQLTIALLLHGQRISEELLLKETQARIVADLTREQMEREWLESAQRQAVKTYVGLHRHATIGIDGGSRERTATPVEERLKIENTPRLLLYPKANGKEWGVKLELQDLRSLASRIRILEHVIAGNYCTVAGTNGSPQPKGMFLRPGPHPFALVRWPPDTEPLIKFENAPPELNAFLRMDQLGHPGKVHLFRISPENIGYEIQGKHIRPGQKYIVVSKSPIRHDGMIFKQFDLKCEGVHSALIETPEEFTSRFEEAVTAVGLTCAKSLRAWPVGLPAKEWDDEGYGVWFTSDRIRVAVRADYELCGVQVAINRNLASFHDVTAPSGEPVLLDLSFLPTGKNTVEIKAIAKHQPHEDLFGYLSAIVREPQVWDIKSANQGALRGFIDPELPSLEEIWTNEVNLEIFGPAGRSVECRLRLFDKSGTSVIREMKISGLTLPVYEQIWRHEFTTKVKKDTSMQEAYDIAHACELFFDADEIGYFTVVGERKSTPIRWAIQKSGHGKKLRYINETETEAVVISRSEFAIPDLPVKIEKIGPGQTLENTDGGLFLIRGKDDLADAIVVPPYGRTLTPGDMKVSPRLRYEYKGDEGVRQLIGLYDLWEQSRTSGSIFSFLWRKQVLKCIANALCSNIGGSHWENAEQEYLEKDDEASLAKLKNGISNKSGEGYIGAKLLKDALSLSERSPKERGAVLGKLFETYIGYLSKKHSVDRTGEGGIVIRTSPAHQLPEFVLRLSSAPNTLLTWEKERFPYFLAHMREFPVIARAGRFLVLVVDRQCDAKSNWYDSCYSGWKWQ